MNAEHLQTLNEQVDRLLKASFIRENFIQIGSPTQFWEKRRMKNGESASILPT